MRTSGDKRLLLIFIGVPALGGALAGWFLTDGQPAGVHAISPFIGAAAAMGVLSITMAFIRVFFGLTRRGRPLPPPKLDPDWRETARKTNERMIRNYRWMARKAWLIALLATLLFTGLFVAASREFVPWLPFAPVLFILIFATGRAVSSFMVRFLTPKPPPSAPHRGD